MCGNGYACMDGYGYAWNYKRNRKTCKTIPL